jgi:hypothetical protein
MGSDQALGGEKAKKAQCREAIIGSAEDELRLRRRRDFLGEIRADAKC